MSPNAFNVPILVLFSSTILVRVVNDTKIDTENKKSATYNCATYVEYRDKDGVTEEVKGWRLPTEAEIELIDQLQNDTKSAVKRIMTGRYYWDSYSANGAKLMARPVSRGSSSDRAHIRCVRDVKDNTI